MVLSLVPAGVFAEPQTISGTAKVASAALSRGYYEETWYFDDSWFTEDANALSDQTKRHLAVLSAIAAGASAADEKSSKNNITDMLSGMGFNDIDSNIYTYKNKKTEDSIGVIIGQKQIADAKGNTYTLLAVVPRSYGYGTEWVSNFTVGESGVHEGFKSARDEVLRFMKEYIDTNYTGGTKFKVWIPGYSRGAAVANLVAGFLSDDPGYFGAKAHFSPENVFAFTTATPYTVDFSTATKGELLSVSASKNAFDTEGSAYIYNGADKDGYIDPAANASNYMNINNYVSDSDYVAMVPFESWGFSRYGKTTPLYFGSDAMVSMLEDISFLLSDAYKDGDYDTNREW
ncbi:MAG: hypothetical protein IK069_00460, partial [Firmicutes bacterium]|nr:hypothetical protein [Bacillota bacterium]